MIDIVDPYSLPALLTDGLVTLHEYLFHAGAAHAATLARTMLCAEENPAVRSHRDSVTVIDPSGQPAEVPLIVWKGVKFLVSEVELRRSPAHVHEEQIVAVSGSLAYRLSVEIEKVAPTGPVLLVFGLLPETAEEPGARVLSQRHPTNKVAMRVRRWEVGEKTFFEMDILAGILPVSVSSTQAA